ncbi:protein artemis [Patella vulgata]|uniref:protein artemis n=1 Tax=Patella vulgata TaxID=6465 RepID=UPI00217F8B91|nr:protein artemis [Patella vulgata]
MSTFCGRMREYRQVSIDRFDKDNLYSTVYFLSHCHRDHMVGLNSTAFINRILTNPNIYLYMSDISKVILMGDNTYDFKALEPQIRILEKSTNTVSIPCNTLSGKPKLVSVTPLPAGHCPGSVMFLFEGDEGTVLYTGDFRWEKNHAANMPALRNELGVKHIKSLYVDTTFCTPSACHFPSRAQCVDVTVRLVEEWLNRSKSHFVYVASPTNYGHEHLQVQIYKHTKHQIHASDWKYSMYSQIQDLADAFTTDPNTRIHACGIKRTHHSKSRLPCGHLFDTEDEELKLLVIRPSTMWFTMSTVRSEKLVEEPMKWYQPHRVCYSFHSSFSEIKDLVSYLNPDAVYPNVIPAQEPDEQMVQARLNSFLRKEDKLLPEDDNARPLGNLKRKKSVTTRISSSLSDNEDLVFDSPVKSKRLKTMCKVAQMPEKVAAPNFSSLTDFQASQLISPAKSDQSHADSSYQGSDDSGSEMDLFSSPTKELIDEEVISSWQEGEALRLYISSDEESDEEEISTEPDCESSNQVKNKCRVQKESIDIEKQVQSYRMNQNSRSNDERGSIESGVEYILDKVLSSIEEISSLKGNLASDPQTLDPQVKTVKHEKPYAVEQMNDEMSDTENGSFDLFDDDEDLKYKVKASTSKQVSNIENGTELIDNSHLPPKQLTNLKVNSYEPKVDVQPSSSNQIDNNVDKIKFCVKTENQNVFQGIEIIEKEKPHLQNHCFEKSEDNNHTSSSKAADKSKESFKIKDRLSIHLQKEKIELKDIKRDTLQTNSIFDTFHDHRGQEINVKRFVNTEDKFATNFVALRPIKTDLLFGKQTLQNNDGSEMIIISDDESIQSSIIVESDDESDHSDISFDSYDQNNAEAYKSSRSCSRSPSILKNSETTCVEDISNVAVESDSDVTLPPSQNSFNPSILNGADTGSISQSDSSDSEVEILYEDKINRKESNKTVLKYASPVIRHHNKNLSDCQLIDNDDDNDVIDLTEDSQRY